MGHHRAGRKLRGRPRATRALAAAVIAAALAQPAAAASGERGDGALLRTHAGAFPAAEFAAGSIGPPLATQAAYDRARNLQEALRRAAPVGEACRPLLAALARYASGRVLQAEGVDRPSARDRAAGRARARRARARVAAVRPRCRGTGGGTGGPRATPIAPADGEAFFGTIVVRAPRGATAAVASSRGLRSDPAPVRGRTVRLRVGWPPGAHHVRVTFLRDGRPVGAVVSRGARLLPRSARAAAAGVRRDAALTRALRAALADGPRHRAAWVQGLASGRVAQVNAAAAFPAASTVKLGLLVGAMSRLGAPLSSPYAYDLRAMTTWSSNLAGNRLIRRFGSAAAREGLRRLGARRSTFTGEYVVGTELQPALPPSDAPDRPPAVSSRVTTAEDLGRMLVSLHASAVDAGARRHTGLTAHQARLALGWLLASQQRGGNASLFGTGVPTAQKNGWISSSRLGAAIIYGPRGPVVAVLATYDAAGVSLARARLPGRRVAAVALRANE